MSPTLSPRLDRILGIVTPGLVLIAIFWLVRLLAGFGGGPGWILTIVSVTVGVALALLISVVRLFQVPHTFLDVFLVCFFLVLFSELLIVLAILIAVVSGIDNIYVAPEFSMHIEDRYHLLHMLGHLISIPVLTLIGGGVAALILWIINMILRDVPQSGQRS